MVQSNSNTCAAKAIRYPSGVFQSNGDLSQSKGIESKSMKYISCEARNVKFNVLSTAYITGNGR